ncbi:MBL fold metallo-hydrolase [Candidatus Kaiserbacteria bacterium]|nr:MBL fold metallo-hydrolase [Candidatus Kaiserbacteria bacterium]
MRKSTKITGTTLLALLVVIIIIACATWAEDRRGLLTVSFLNVGQGDAIFIDSPSGRQVLIDGGPDASVLRELSRTMPWYDRSIDVMIGTHPDLDHIGGLMDVLDRYRIGTIIQSSVLGSTPAWKTFEKEIEAEKAQVLIAGRGQVIDLGRGAYIEILFPDRTVPRIETNVGCVVARVVYGETSFMLPCDTTDEIEKYLVRLDGPKLKSDVLKAAHHGSKTSSSPIFVGLVDPAYAIFSRGCNNSYGHPHQQTIETFARLGIPTLDTCTEGTIIFISDGERIVRK